jgi:hypothetical protein
MAVQTKNLTETIRNSRKQRHCFGMEKHQNHNVTGTRRQFAKIQSKYIKEKIKKYGMMK